MHGKVVHVCMVRLSVLNTAASRRAWWGVVWSHPGKAHPLSMPNPGAKNGWSMQSPMRMGVRMSMGVLVTGRTVPSGMAFSS